VFERGGSLWAQISRGSGSSTNDCQRQKTGFRPRLSHGVVCVILRLQWRGLSVDESKPVAAESCLLWCARETAVITHLDQLLYRFVNGKRELLKMSGYPTLKASWTWPWIRSYGILSRISHRPLPTCQISWNRRVRSFDDLTQVPICLINNNITGTFWHFVHVGVKWL